MVGAAELPGEFGNRREENVFAGRRRDLRGHFGIAAHHTSGSTSGALVVEG
jgi:hypothetical protein